MINNSPKYPDQTPFDALNLPQDDNTFKQELRVLYNDVVSRNGNWDDLVEQLKFTDQPYIKGYIKNKLLSSDIASGIGRVYHPHKPLNVLNKLQKIWDASKPRKKIAFAGQQPSQRMPS